MDQDASNADESYIKMDPTPAETRDRMRTGWWIQFWAGLMLFFGGISLVAGLLSGRWLPVENLEQAPAVSAAFAVLATCFGVLGLRAGWGIRYGRIRWLGLFTLATFGLMAFSVCLLVAYGQGWYEAFFFGFVLWDCLEAYRWKRRAAALPGDGAGS